MARHGPPMHARTFPAACNGILSTLRHGHGAGGWGAAWGGGHWVRGDRCGAWHLRVSPRSRS
eukprot:3399070-Alexandrium_andersonii.AAC.1